MRYSGNTAYQLDTRQAWDVPVRRSLSVHEGGRAHTRMRRQEAPAIAPVYVLVAALFCALTLVGILRVSINVATVKSLKQVSIAQSALKDEEVRRTQLQVERSALSSADRIQRIATENYGMVYASDIDTIVIDSSAGEEFEASVDEEFEASADEEFDAFADDAQSSKEADDASGLS